MSDQQPTAEEIKRVEAWKATEEHRRVEERNKKWEAQRLEKIDSVKKQLTGTVVSVIAEVTGICDDVRMVTLIYDNGRVVQIDGSWGEERDIDIITTVEGT